MTGTGGFQTQVNVQPVMAIEGDFASHNPYFTFDAGPGGLVAGGPSGVKTGKFAWVTPPLDPDGTPSIAQNFGFGPVAGFVFRNNQGLITQYLANSGEIIQPGFQMGLMVGGDFWVTNAGSTQALIGQKAFANLTTGTVSFAAAGSSPGGASDSGGAVVNTTLTLVGGVQGNILTVASVSAGTIYPGAVLNSNAVGKVQAYGTGGTTGTGSAGTYMLDTGEQNVATGTTIGGNYGVYTVGTATGVFAVGMVLSGGTTLPTGAAAPVLTHLISGTGGDSSTFSTNSGTAAQTTHALVGSSAIETKWYAMSSGLAGELVKISDHATG